MTPFGAKIRALREKKNMTLTDMAQALQLSPAYLSALEHGHRGRPSPGLVQQICGLFDIIWDDAEELKGLAKLSHPKVTVDTSGLMPNATEAANLLAEKIGRLSPEQLEELLVFLRTC